MGIKSVWTPTVSAHWISKCSAHLLLISWVDCMHTSLGYRPSYTLLNDGLRSSSIYFGFVYLGAQSPLILLSSCLTICWTSDSVSTLTLTLTLTSVPLSAWLYSYSLFWYKPQILSLINWRHLASSSRCWSITLLNAKAFTPLPCTCLLDFGLNLTGHIRPVELAHGCNNLA